MNKVFRILIILVLFLFSGKMPGQELIRLVPDAAELQGWKVVSEPKVYTGDDLFDLIDGGADIYFEYGFVKVITIRYADPSQNIIQVEIYEMDDAPSAYGIFSITQQAAEWSQQYGHISTATENYISYWKSKFYVNISWSSRQHLDQPLLNNLANLISKKIVENGAYPAIVQTFKAEDAGRKAVYMKGNLALSNYYYFDYKDILRLKEAIAWSTGGYHRIIIRYADKTACLDALGWARQSVQNNKRFSDVAVAFQGFSCKDNKGNNILFRQIENYIAVLVALDESLSLPPIMDEITLEVEMISE
jgi:hypothetical protein